MPQNVTVTITKVPNNPQLCDVRPKPFIANPGSMVTFVFAGTPDADIIFKNGRTPFKEGKLKPGTTHEVIAVPSGTDRLRFDFDVKWSGGLGTGDGTGEVVPG